jgi:RNA-directed DNA polymerase
LRSRHGGCARANFTLVAPLVASTAITDMLATDTDQLDLFEPAPSGAVAGLRIRPADVDAANDRRTPTTSAGPGTRTSTTATRTTTTRTTSSEPARSAAWKDADFSFADVVEAYLDCRRTKRTTPSALAFEAEHEAHLVELYARLAGGTYTPGRSICFIIDRPKPREIWAAPFPDRIPHHLLYNRVGPRFERSFIADSCACIEGRGTLYAARRLESKVRSITRNWQRPAHYLKCDVANFFVSIDKRILAGLLERRIPEPFWRDLARTILLHDPREDVEVRGASSRLALIPPHKSLFTQDADHGLPIGNLSSQFFANVYLDELDQFVTHRLRARHYVRYVDDFVLLHESTEQLNAWRAGIEAFLAQRLRLELNTRKTILQPIARGIDFVGQVIKPHRRTLRRRTFNEALSRLARPELAGEDLWRSANSYLGLARQATHSHRDRCRLANVLRRRGVAVDHNLTKAYA